MPTFKDTMETLCSPVKKAAALATSMLVLGASTALATPFTLSYDADLIAGKNNTDPSSTANLVINATSDTADLLAGGKSLVSTWGDWSIDLTTAKGGRYTIDSANVKGLDAKDYVMLDTDTGTVTGCSLSLANDTFTSNTGGGMYIFSEGITLVQIGSIAQLLNGNNTYGGCASCGGWLPAYPVPENNSLLLFGFGLLGAAAIARRKAGGFAPDSSGGDRNEMIVRGIIEKRLKKNKGPELPKQSPRAAIKVRNATLKV